MDAEAPATPCTKPPASLPPPPALFAVRARSRVAADLDAGAAAFSGPPDTPPRRSPLTVPFLWEEAPGKPKVAPPTAATNAGGDRQEDSGHADEDQARGPLPLKLPPRLQQVPSFAGSDDGDRQDSSHAEQARALPLKLPPRLQQVPSFAAADTPLSSPKTVLQGPYYGCAGGGGRPPRWARSGGAALRRTPSSAVKGVFSRTWSKPKAAAAPGSNNKNRGGDHERDAAGTDAPWCSPASSSSSSSVSTCFGGDDHGGRGRHGDGREVSSEEADGSPWASVRITRFRRNRSLPSRTTSNLWASIRRSVKQITLWS